MTRLDPDPFLEVARTELIEKRGMSEVEASVILAMGLIRVVRLLEDCGLIEPRDQEGEADAD